MKSVCFVVQMVYDVDARVRRKAEALVAEGYSVDVLALRPPDHRKAYTLNGVNVRTVSLGKHRGSLARYLFEYAAFFCWVFLQLILLMPRRSYAVVDVNTLPDFLIFAAIPAKLGGAKLVLDMHEITPEFYMSKYRISRQSWTVRILTFIEKISFDFADRVITINEPIEDLLVSRGLAHAKSTIIMNAADENRFADKTDSSGSLGHRSGKSFIMMYHGTLTHIYGLDIAIEAFALAHNQMPGAELWILGSGTQENALAKLAHERGLDSKVKLLGQVPSSDIPGWLGLCDAGILPIRRDAFLDLAFPNKLPECIIMNKPVIISRLKAIHYYFSEASLAYFEPNNPLDLAKRMVGVYQDPIWRGQLAERARQEYEPIRWEVMKQRYLKLMGDMTGQPFQPTCTNHESNSSGWARTSR